VLPTELELACDQEEVAKPRHEFDSHWEGMNLLSGTCRVIASHEDSDMRFSEALRALITWPRLSDGAAVDFGFHLVSNITGGTDWRGQFPALSRLITWVRLILVSCF